MGRLFWKIFLAFWLALVAAAVGTGTVVWLQRAAVEGAERKLALGPPHRIAIDMAAATLRHGGVEALREWMQGMERGRPAPLFAVSEDGRDLLGRAVPEGALARARELAAQPNGEPGARLVAAPGGETYLLFVPATAALRLPPPPLIVYKDVGEPFGRGLPPAAKIVVHRERPLPPWALIVIGVLTSLAFSALLAWYLARPIRSLRWAFDAAAAGRLETRVRPLMAGRRDEIADLGRDFDRMASQLQALVSAQRHLLHDVSHELRSPLARLQAAIGLARQSPDKLEPSLDRIEREAARLDELVGEVLTLARLESATAPANGESVDLADLVASIAQDARFEAQAAGRDVKLDLAGEPLVAGRAELLQRAVENVVRNAVKYTAHGTTVEIALRAQGDPPRAVLTVSDRGPGIPAEELDRIFEPFYRSPGGNAGGFGLGLAIARRAIEAHGGTICAANVGGSGLRVEIELPAQ